MSKNSTVQGKRFRFAQANGIQSTIKVTKTNVINSIKTVIVETAVNGTVSTVTGKIAGKIVSTNKGWFKPQKFVSSFSGKYAIKSELQSWIGMFFDKRVKSGIICIR